MDERGDGMRTRVGIVSDQPVVRLGTTAILGVQTDMHVTAVADTVDGLYAYGQEIDVILLDLDLSDGSAPGENVRALMRGGARVLAYLSRAHPRRIREAARAGAVGVIRTSEPAAAIVDAVRRAARGQQALGDAWGWADDSVPALQDPGLSARERDVIRRYASGGTATEVAAALFISSETVYDHIRRVRAKYAAAGRQANTKIQLLQRAHEDGILPGPDGRILPMPERA